MSVPYDGGDIGAFQSFGTMGRPDYAHGIMLAQAPTGELNSAFFVESAVLNTWVEGAPITIDTDGLIAFEYRYYNNAPVISALIVNGRRVSEITHSTTSILQTHTAFVKAGDIVKMATWGHATVSDLIINGWLYMYPSVYDTGSISANSYMTY
jgi:hypothetical protein